MSFPGLIYFAAALLKRKSTNGEGRLTASSFHTIKGLDPLAIAPPGSVFVSPTVKLVHIHARACKIGALEYQSWAAGFCEQASRQAGRSLASGRAAGEDRPIAWLLAQPAALPAAHFSG